MHLWSGAGHCQALASGLVVENIRCIPRLNPLPSQCYGQGPSRRVAHVRAPTRLSCRANSLKALRRLGHGPASMSSTALSLKCCLWWHNRCVLSVVAQQVCAVCGGTTGVCCLWWHNRCVLSMVAQQVCAVYGGTTGVRCLWWHNRCVLSMVAQQVCAVYGGTTGVCSQWWHNRCVLSGGTAGVCAVHAHTLCCS